MHALLLGHRSAARLRVHKFLTSSGHEVDVCHDGRWGCAGLDGRCPLDARHIDVAVAVAAPGVGFDAQGVTCVQRARIPLVTIGARARDPIAEYASANVARADVAALEMIAAASHDATGHRHAVEEMITSMLRAGEEVAVEAHRRTDAIDVRLSGNVGRHRLGELADLARAATRAHDPQIGTINVSVVSD